MNGEIKWHKATGPAFQTGEVWVGSGGAKVSIESVRKYPGASSDHISDYGVTYTWTLSSGEVKRYEKDAWSFQVRYTHIADLALRFS